MATNKDVYLNIVNGTAVLQDAASNGKAIGKITLNYGDTMTVHTGSGFSRTPTISKVEIYNWVNGAKGSPVGNWPDNTTVGCLTIAPSGTTVVVTDGDDGENDADYGYGVSATMPGRTAPYTADPELLAKKKMSPTMEERPRTTSPRPPEAGA